MPRRHRREDYLPAYRCAGVRGGIEARGASLRYLPPYLPDFNPIESAFARLKALLRDAVTRAIEDLWHVVDDPLPPFEPRQSELRHRRGI